MKIKKDAPIIAKTIPSSPILIISEGPVGASVGEDGLTVSPGMHPLTALTQK